jgi:hypothetical protein
MGEPHHFQPGLIDKKHMEVGAAHHDELAAASH